MSYTLLNNNIIKEVISPKLIEPGTHYFFKETLKNCKKIKYSFYNKLFNIIITLIFVLAISTFLYIQYKNVNNKKLKENQEKIKEYQYGKIMRIIEEHNQEKARQRQELITNLPTNTSIKKTFNNNNNINNNEEQYLGAEHLLDPNIKFFM